MAAAQQQPAALELRGIVRNFAQGRHILCVLDGASLKLDRGEFVGLVGPSGSGKSTLLHIAGLLDRPSRGSVHFDGADCGTLDDRARSALRCFFVGFVYQYPHLLGEFTALENVMLAPAIAGAERGAAARRAGELLSKVGLANRRDHRPGALSGGEQQRVALARALANAPSLLLADEPTGNLDARSAEDVMDLMRSTAKEMSCAAIVATHNRDLARRFDRVLELCNGRLIELAPEDRAMEAHRA